VLTLSFTNPFETRKAESLSYQALGACFEPYKALPNLKTKSGCAGSTNSGDYLTYTSSSIKLFKNALLTSI